MGRTLEYPKKSYNIVKRYKELATYELGPIHKLINDSLVLNVSFNPIPSESDPDPFPVILPMIGVMGSFEYPSSDISEPLDCYLHGSISARLCRLAKDTQKGLPVCIATNKVDGLSLSLTPYSHNYNYRSATLQGYAKPVESVEEKLFAMELITDKVTPGRWKGSRTPPDNAEVTSTAILKVKIETGSGKVRDGGPVDEKKDLDNADIRNKVWVGTIPVYETFGDPVAGDYNKVEEVPEYVTSHVVETTAANKQFAIDTLH